MSSFSKIILVFTNSLVFIQIQAWDDTCQRFSQIYKDGKDLCETMWGSSFVYEEDEDKAYTMWWFDTDNPNSAVSKLNTRSTPDTCAVQYFHKNKPSPSKSKNFTECLPFNGRNCCRDSTVVDVNTMRDAYGAGYEWDRCGDMSQACERFFVQESCFYECEIIPPKYRRCSDQDVANAGTNMSDPCFENTWEIFGTPIKASYCDAWYEACYNDKFCGGLDGDFFSCAAYYSKSQEDQPAPSTSDGSKGNNGDGGLPDWAVALIIILILVVALSIFAFGFMISKEKRGEPIFKPLDASRAAMA